MRYKQLIKYLWLMWLGYVLGALPLSPIPLEESWSTEMRRQVVRAYATVYSRTCWRGLVIISAATIFLIVLGRLKRDKPVTEA
jgi:hypothetical protein